MEKLRLYLPEKIMQALDPHREICEVRIKRNSRVGIKSEKGEMLLDLQTEDECFNDIIDRLLEHSYHSKLGELTRGYISLGDGYRVGVVGQAVTTDGTVTNISEIDSVCIRVPRLLRGVGRELISYLALNNYTSNILVYSAPGVGKTTLLRDLAMTLSDAPIYKKIALIDSRKEICLKEMKRCPLLYIYSGYPKAKAIEMAIRTISPDFILCDEIGSREDAEAIFSGLHAGVSLIATAHGNNYQKLLRRENLKQLCQSGAFDCLVGIKRYEKGNSFRFEFKEVANA